MYTASILADHSELKGKNNNILTAKILWVIYSKIIHLQ